MTKSYNRLGFSLLLVAALSTALAQFSASRYFEQCLRFEAGGDLQTAKQSCLNALELRDDFSEAELALARVELALGNVGAAESALLGLRDRVGGAEPQLLLAEAALMTERLTAAEDYLAAAQQRLAAAPSSELTSRLDFVAGRVAEAGANVGEALERYRRAVTADPLNLSYTLRLAQLLFDIGDPAGARAQLESYERLSEDARSPELLSLLGRIQWAQSDFEGAISSLETAVTLRGSRNAQAQQADLRSLALIYYAQGDLRSGGLALRAAMRRGTLLLYLLNRSVLWLGLLVLLVGVHLFGESRIPSTNTSLLSEAGKLWTLSSVYTVLLSSLVLSLGAALAYSWVRYENVLALLTPLQSADVRALFFACLGLLLFIFTLLSVGRGGLDPLELLLGRADQVPLGVVAGLGLLGVTLAYLHFRPDSALLEGYYLDFSRLTPTLVAAAILVPLSEVFFRAYTFQPLAKRYDDTLALLISGTLFALVFAAPILLLLTVGLALAELFRRGKSGMNTLVAQLVIHLGFVVGTAFLPWVRGLF